jgi:hypothetical protein
VLPRHQPDLDDLEGRKRHRLARARERARGVRRRRREPAARVARAEPPLRSLQGREGGARAGRQADDLGHGAAVQLAQAAARGAAVAADDGAERRAEAQGRGAVVDLGARLDELERVDREALDDAAEGPCGEDDGLGAGGCWCCSRLRLRLRLRGRRRGRRR